MLWYKDDLRNFKPQTPKCAACKCNTCSTYSSCNMRYGDTKEYCQDFCEGEAKHTEECYLHQPLDDQWENDFVIEVEE